MALVKCKECGEQVSTTAAACPKCGAKPPKPTSLGAWIGLIVFVLIVFSCVMSSVDKGNGSSVSAVSHLSEPAKSGWRTFQAVDQMTNKRSEYAESPMVKSTYPMSFPYSDVTAQIGVGCEGKKEWAYVSFATAPNLNNTDTESGYSVIHTRVKWDNALVNTRFTQKWGADTIFFDDVGVPARLAKSHQVLLELDWHSQSNVVFSFPMDGAAAALDSARKSCRGK